MAAPACWQRPVRWPGHAAAVALFGTILVLLIIERPPTGGYPIGVVMMMGITGAVVMWSLSVLLRDWAHWYRHRPLIITRYRR